jgi:hypothetical protein
VSPVALSLSALQLQVVLHTKGQQQRAVQRLQAVRKQANTLDYVVPVSYLNLFLPMPTKGCLTSFFPSLPLPLLCLSVCDVCVGGV